MTGLLGGVFDPPHNAHVILAETALRRFGLERLVVLVTGVPPHKQVATPPEVRYRLAEAAFTGLPGIELSRHELRARERAYTVDTVRWARRRYGDVLYLVGADEFADFLSWRDPEGILRAARLGVASRPGYRRERLDAVLRRVEQPQRVTIFEIPALAISSTQVRERAAAGEPIGDLVPAPVAELVVELGLYREVEPRGSA